MTRYPDLALTLACLAGAALTAVLGGWSRRAVAGLVLPRVPVGMERLN